MPELLSRISELWLSFSLPVANRPVHIAPVGTLDEVRRGAVKNLTRLIPCVQVTRHISLLVHHLKLVLDGNKEEFRKDAIDALCCLAHALGEDFTIFIPSIHKLMVNIGCRTCPVGLEMLFLIEFVWRNDLRLSLMFLKSTWARNPTFVLNISLVVTFEPNPFYWQPHYKPYPF
uniref:TOR (TARGET OF RAPAMYCIN); 1-phosphatidylinositol-3-kinase/ protein binding n=1 Tax=Solanum tuberosum TaxID=4113 RepID=M0ZKJ2_SOLTU